MLATFSTCKTTRHQSKVNTPKIAIESKAQIKLNNDFIGFKEALAFKESQGRYSIVNPFGYLGKYQFGRVTLRHFKIYNYKGFLGNPVLQEDTFEALCKVNKWILRREINTFSGKKIKGIHITESGILAAAHLVGATKVKRFLKSRGGIQYTDAYGTTITSYLKIFSGFDISYIKADVNAKVS